MKLTPRSSARFSARSASSSSWPSHWPPPSPQDPYPTSDTSRPVRPSRRLATCTSVSLIAAPPQSFRWRIRLAVLRQEGEHPLPRLGGGVGELLLFAVEEAVRRPVEDDDLVRHAGRGQRLVERRVVLREDVPVGSRLER